MKKRIILAGLSVPLALLLRAAPAASEGGSAEGAAAAATADAGGRKVRVSGSKSKFGEYRDARDGFLLNEFRFASEGGEEPFFLDLRARNAARSDESYRVRAGRYGSFKVDALFDRTPHDFSEGRLILGGAGTANLTLSGQIQTNLQALEQSSCERYNGKNPGDGGCPAGAASGAKVPDPKTDYTGEDALQQALIRDLQSIAEPTAFRVDRKRGALSLDFDLGGGVQGRLKVDDERRTGARQIGAGSYERWFQGASGLTHTSDKFMVTGMELAEPVDYQTTSIGAGAGVYRKEWSADLDYTFTDFHDRNTALVWANPFRAIDMSATNMSTSVANNAFNRGGFSRGQLSLPPSSKSHDLTASGSVELPFESRLTASLGYGLVSQQDLLLPYTLNSGIAGVGGAPANVTSADALPTARFQGEVRKLTQSYVLSGRPTQRLGAKLKYRYYDYANRSEQILFPGYAAFGESYWRATKNDVAGAKVLNDVASYNRQTAELGFDYELARPLTLSLDAFSDKWDYAGMRVDKTKELGAGAGFAWHASHAARLHGGYKFARRTVLGYERGGRVINPEAKGLANYNWADRKRHRADIGADLEPADSLALGFGASYQDDALGAGERFGLKSRRSASASVDASYEPSEGFSLRLDYSREQTKSRMNNGAKDDAAGLSAWDAAGFPSDNFNPLNYWNTDMLENVDTVGVGATARPDENWEFTAGYSLSYSRMRFSSLNPNAETAAAAGMTNGTVKLGNALAQNWPAVVGRFHEVRAGASCRLRRDLRVGLNYLFERYTLEDFANTGAYPAGSTPENTTRYVWAGGNQFDYTAHVLGTYLSYRF